MSHLLDSYRRNAESARLEAERTTLPNVRERAAKAEATWTDLANRLQKVEDNQRARDHPDQRN